MQLLPCTAHLRFVRCLLCAISRPSSFWHVKGADKTVADALSRVIFNTDLPAAIGYSALALTQRTNSELEVLRTSSHYLIFQELPLSEGGEGAIYGMSTGVHRALVPFGFQ